MRDIKFRGKRIDNGGWVYGDLWHAKSTYIVDVYADTYIVDPATVGQFTGLKDNKGNDIYEGNILRVYTYFNEEEPELNEYEDVVVEWDDDGKCLAIEFDFGDYDITAIGYAFMHFENSGYEVEVIGNIFENLELLKKEVSKN